MADHHGRVSGVCHLPYLEMAGQRGLILIAPAEQRAMVVQSLRAPMEAMPWNLQRTWGSARTCETRAARKRLRRRSRGRKMQSSARGDLQLWPTKANRREVYPSLACRRSESGFGERLRWCCRDASNTVVTGCGPDSCYILRATANTPESEHATVCETCGRLDIEDAVL